MRPLCPVHASSCALTVVASLMKLLDESAMACSSDKKAASLLVRTLYSRVAGRRCLWQVSRKLRMGVMPAHMQDGAKDRAKMQSQVLDSNRAFKAYKLAWIQG